MSPGLADKDDIISLKRVGTMVAIMATVTTVGTPIVWKLFQVGDHEKRLEKLEASTAEQNKLLMEIRGDVKAMRQRNP